MTRSMSRWSGLKGFTLVELLVVIGIIAVLIGILMPTLSHARSQARAVHCMANMRSIGQTMLVYANNNRGRLPMGVYLSGYQWPDFANPAVYDDWSFMKNTATPGMNFFGALIRVNPAIKGNFVCVESQLWPKSDGSKVQCSYLVNGLMVNRLLGRIRGASDVAVLQEDRFHFDTAWERPERSVDSNTAKGYLGSYTSPFAPAFAVPFSAADKYSYWSWQPGGSIAEYGNIHNKGGNLLMADGHAIWVAYKNVHARMFGLTSGPGVAGQPDDDYNTGIGTSTSYRSAID